jgi:hypothetical protein
MKWIFELGCNNSGTTLLYNLLAQHPEIDPVKGEGQDIVLYSREGGQIYYHGGYPHGFLLPNPRIFYNPQGEPIIRVWSERLSIFRNPEVNLDHLKYVLLQARETTSGTYTMEKSPTNTVRSLWIQNKFPDSHFLGITRNGYAVCEGIKRKFDKWLHHMQRAKGGIYREYASMDMKRAAKHWRLVNKTMLEDSKNLDSFHLVSYEKLCEAPQEELEKITYFLNLAPHQFQVEHVQNRNQESFDRLTEEDYEVITRYAGRLIKEL